MRPLEPELFDGADEVMADASLSAEFATLASLVTRLTSDRVMDYTAMTDFLLTFRMFSAPGDILHLLFSRLAWAAISSATNQGSERGRDVAVRTFVVIRYWFLNFFADDFLPNTQLRQHGAWCINTIYSMPEVQNSRHLVNILDQLKRTWLSEICAFWDLGGEAAMASADMSLPVFAGGDYSASLGRELLPRSTSKRRLTLLRFYDGPITPIPEAPPQAPQSNPIAGPQLGSLVRGGILIDGDVAVSQLRTSPTKPRPKKSLLRLKFFHRNRPAPPTFQPQSEEIHLNNKVDFLALRVVHELNAMLHTEPPPPPPQPLDETLNEQPGIYPPFKLASILSNISSSTSSEEMATPMGSPIKSSASMSPLRTPKRWSSVSTMRAPSRDKTFDTLDIGHALASNSSESEVNVDMGEDTVSVAPSASGTMSMDPPGVEDYYEESAVDLRQSTGAWRGLGMNVDFDRASYEGSLSSLSTLSRPSMILKDNDKKEDGKYWSHSGSYIYDNAEDDLTDLQVSQNPHDDPGNGLEDVPYEPQEVSPQETGSPRRLARRNNFVQTSPRPDDDPQSQELQLEQDSSLHTNSVPQWSDGDISLLSDIDNGDMVPCRGFNPQVAAELAAIPDEDIDREDAVFVALQKLEGTYKRRGLVPSFVSSGTTGLYSQAFSSRTDLDTGPSANNLPLDKPNQAEIECLAISDALRPYNADPSLVSATNSEDEDRQRFETILSGPLRPLADHAPFVLSVPAKILADQMTLIERDALEHVDWKELVEVRWSREPRAVHSWLGLLAERPQLTGVEVVVARFNLVVGWVKSEILLCGSSMLRAQTVSRLIHCALACLQAQNFATTVQILLALTSQTIAGLRQVWPLVPQTDRDTLTRLEALISPTRNFARMRRAHNSIDLAKGCIPFTGLYLADLVYNDQKPSVRSSDSQINFGKFQASAALVRSLVQCIEWAKNCPAKPQPAVLSKCLYLHALSEDEMQQLLRD